MFMTGALPRLLTMALAEEACRAKQGLQIVLACALGQLLQQSCAVHSKRCWLWSLARRLCTAEGGLQTVFAYAPGNSAYTVSSGYTVSATSDSCGACC